MTDLTKEHLDGIAAEAARRVLTLGELAALGDRLGLPLGQVVVGEAMVREGKSREEILGDAFAAFDHNLAALDKGLADGVSFLLGTVGSDLAGRDRPALIGDDFIDRAQIYTLATEVANHEVGLQPCAGTGDSCPYTGLLRAMIEDGHPPERIHLTAALLLKVGSVFRAGKVTTGCNMEGYGAGAAATAAALTDLRGGSAGQAARAMVLALSPTIAVPCTPRVVTRGLCAAHIAGAILMGNMAANLVLKSSLPVDVDIDVMVAMAARIHREAAPVITAINTRYLKHYFSRRPEVEGLVDPAVAARDGTLADEVLGEAREEVRRMMATSAPLAETLGDVVVGGSSIAVGSPTNMARVAHALKSGRIRRIDIELTRDLFERRAINVPGILMGAVFGSPTGDGATYRKVMDLPEVKAIDITVREAAAPEVQRIRIGTDERGSWVDARNRGGARLAIVDAEPTRNAALEAATRLGIQVVD